MGSVLQMHFFFVVRADDFTRNKCFNAASMKDQSSQIFMYRLIVMLKIIPKRLHPHPPAYNWGMLLFPSSSKYHPQCIPTVTEAAPGEEVTGGRGAAGVTGQEEHGPQERGREAQTGVLFAKPQRNRMEPNSYLQQCSSWPSPTC